MSRTWAELLGDADEGAREAEERSGFFSRLRDSLGKSRRALAPAADPGRPGRGASKVCAPWTPTPTCTARAEKGPLFDLGNQQMAGVQGKSGGPRPNSGGARPGAGRKPKAATEKSANAAVETKLEPQPRGGALKRKKAVPVEIEPCDMLTLLQRIALGQVDGILGEKALRGLCVGQDGG